MSEVKTIPFEEHTRIVQRYQSDAEKAKRLEAQVVDMEKRLEKFNGVDVDAHRAIKEELEFLKQEKAKQSPEDLEEYKKTFEHQIRGEYQGEFDKLKSELEKARSKTHELEVVDRAMEKIGDRFNADTHKFIKTIIRDSVARDENGNFYLRDSDGKPLYSEKEPSKRMGLDDLASKLADEHPSFAKADYISGTKQTGEKITNSVSGWTAERYAKASSEERARLPRDVASKLNKEVLKTMKIKSNK